MEVKKETSEKQITFLQYLNTVILTVISIVLIFLFTVVINVKDNQEANAKELIRMKTIQDINTGNINTIDNRVKSLELSNESEVKTWVDNNYLRKPQKL